ncbi:MAG: MBL fold metallo-hydrolase [Chloracidobacterium sp.]|nr:MBL fold metallo-hydrolase [Chloracidobacterium sp.]
MLRRLQFVGVILAASVTAGLLALGCRTVEPASFIATGDMNEELPQGKSVEVRYIANEGVLISSRDKRVLIDGLHRKYDDAYAYLPDDEREKIEAAKPPFENIDLILVSHYHGDHFHPESVGRYLQSSPKSLLATSEQVVAEVAAKFSSYATIKGRIAPVTYSFKERITRNVGGIDVEFLSVGHGTGRFAAIQNLAHVFTLGGKKFLHVGDAEMSVPLFDHYDLDKQGIDVAFMPAWFLTNAEGRTIIREHIKPKHIIAVHVGPTEAASLEQQIKDEFPDADVFGTMLEKRVL